ARRGPDEARARAALLDLHWQADRFHELAAGEDAGPADLVAQLARRRTHRTEVAALQAALAEAGIPLRAPPDFVPPAPVD
ncbi:MAG TPA: hypothetical protein VFO79_08075, partial [Xanthomonadales bacterium]|nr:hypothetical protein [Xanthomonadales bacterium]